MPDFNNLSSLATRFVLGDISKGLQETYQRKLTAEIEATQMKQTLIALIEGEWKRRILY